MMFTDTHIHLYASEFEQRLDDLIKDAFNKQINRFFIPNIDQESMVILFEICRKYPSNCFPALGLHPCNVKSDYLNQLQVIKAKAECEKIYAIGETGMDLYWDKTLIKEQQEAFIIQMQWARQWNLPLIIHSRNSTNEIIQLIESHQELKPFGIFHCFSGTIEQAEKIIALGFYLGIGGVITFKNSGLDKIVSHVDIDHLVLETDAPYLAPVPHRGKQNEPAYLYLVAEKLAAIKNISIEEVAFRTTKNSQKIFSV